MEAKFARDPKYPCTRLTPSTSFRRWRLLAPALAAMFAASAPALAQAAVAETGSRSAPVGPCGHNPCPTLTPAWTLDCNRIKGLLVVDGDKPNPRFLKQLSYLAATSASGDAKGILNCAAACLRDKIEEIIYASGTPGTGTPTPTPTPALPGARQPLDVYMAMLDAVNDELHPPFFRRAGNAVRGFLTGNPYDFDLVAAQADSKVCSSPLPALYTGSPTSPNNGYLRQLREILGPLSQKEQRAALLCARDSVDQAVRELMKTPTPTPTAAHEQPKNGGAAQKEPGSSANDQPNVPPPPAPAPKGQRKGAPAQDRAPVQPQIGEGTQRSVDSPVDGQPGGAPTAKPSPGKGSSGNGSSVQDALDFYTDLRAHLDVDINNLDPRALKIDMYAGTQFSNLYKAKDSDPYFSKSKPLLVVEIAQTLTSRLDLATYGLLTFQSSSQATGANTTEVLTATAGFGAEGGLVYWPAGADNSRVVMGVIAGIGTLAFRDPECSGSSPLAKCSDGKDTSTTTDFFHRTTRVGLIFRQNTGLWEGSFSEFGYYRDPRFPSSNRFLGKVRVVLSPRLANEKASGLGAYVEGVVNEGKGKDEARVTIGVRLDLLSVLRGIVGAPSSGSPTTSGKPKAE